jgi:hypothetical protein
MPKWTPEQLEEGRRKRAESEAKWREYEASRPHYVPPLTTLARVTLTTALATDGTGQDFLGEYEGDPIRVHIYGADAIRVRHAIRNHGSVMYDSPGSYVHDAKPEDLRAVDPEHIPLSYEERVALATLRLLILPGEPS